MALLLALERTLEPEPHPEPRPEPEPEPEPEPRPGSHQALEQNGTDAGPLHIPLSAPPDAAAPKATSKAAAAAAAAVAAAPVPPGGSSASLLLAPKQCVLADYGTLLRDHGARHYLLLTTHYWRGFPNPEPTLTLSLP